MSIIHRYVPCTVTICSHNLAKIISVTYMMIIIALLMFFLFSSYVLGASVILGHIVSG